MWDTGPLPPDDEPGLFEGKYKYWHILGVILMIIGILLLAYGDSQGANGLPPEYWLLPRL